MKTNFMMVSVMVLVLGLSGCVVVIGGGGGGPGATQVMTPLDGSEQSNLARTVRDAYLVEPDLRDANLRVTARRHGVIRLSGTVATAQQAERAIAIAQRTPGVTRVESRLSVGG